VEVIEGKAFIRGRIRKVAIGVENGKIVAIKKILYGKTRNYGDMLILPSAVDVHVHFREPGYEYKEDFSTGSKASLLAGITCVGDMPNNIPPIVTDKAFMEKAEKVRGKSYVDYALYAGLKEDMVKYASLYKLYLSGDNEIFVDYDKLPGLLKKIKEKGAILAVHAEDRECIKRKGKNLEEYEKNNPIKCEEIAIKRIVEINERIGAKLHICHVTSAKNAGFLLRKNISFGVTLHHIMFSYKSNFKKEAFGKVNPPLRSRNEQSMLFRMVMSGKIPVLESDHAPHTLEEKENFENAKAGMPGAGALLPVMLYFVRKGKIGLKKLVRMVSKNPAELLGINKGEIAVGKDADFIVVDFDDVRKIRPLSKCGWSCYEGMPAIYPRHVWIRGKIAVEDGEINEKPMGERIK